MVALINAEYHGYEVLQATAICLVGMALLGRFAVNTETDFTGMCLLVFLTLVISTIVGVMVVKFPEMNLHRAGAILGTTAFVIFLATEFQVVHGGRKVELDTDEHLLGALLVFTSALETFKHFLVLWATKKTE